MHRSLWILSFALLICANPAQSLQLSWSTGTQDLQFTTATRCTLVVSTDTQSETLPSAWRLLWVAEACSTLVTVPDTNSTDPAIASADSLPLPSTAEALAHVTTAYFHSGSAGEVSSARWILDLPEGSAGNFQVVAAVPSATSETGRVIARSPIATFNGGIGAPFPPCILDASGDHSTSRLSITATGTGLGSALGVRAPIKTLSLRTCSKSGCSPA